MDRSPSVEGWAWAAGRDQSRPLPPHVWGYMAVYPRWAWTPFQWVAFRDFRRADGAPETVFSRAIPVVLHVTFYEVLLNLQTNVYKEETFLWELDDDPRQDLKIFYNLCRIMISSSSSCFSFLFRFCREKMGMNVFTLLREATQPLELGRQDWGVCFQKVSGRASEHLRI